MTDLIGRLKRGEYRSSAEPARRLVAAFPDEPDARALSAFTHALGLGLEPMSLGWSVGSAGDVNGDGLSDIIVGAPGYSNEPACRVPCSFASNRSHP